MGETRQRLGEEEQGRAELAVANRELGERVEEQRSRLEEGERVRLEARGLGEEDMELLVFDRRELQKEGKELRTQLELRGKQWEEERGRLEDQVLHLHLHPHPHLHLHQVGRVGRMLEEATTELQGSSTDLRLAQGKVCRLEARLRDQVHLHPLNTSSSSSTTSYAPPQGQEVASLTSRLSSASSTSTSLSAAALAATRLEGHQTRLARCSSCSSSSSSSSSSSPTSPGPI